MFQITHEASDENFLTVRITDNENRLAMRVKLSINQPVVFDASFPCDTITVLESDVSVYAEANPLFFAAHMISAIAFAAAELEEWTFFSEIFDANPVITFA